MHVPQEFIIRVVHKNGHVVFKSDPLLAIEAVNVVQKTLDTLPEGDKVEVIAVEKNIKHELS